MTSPQEYIESSLVESPAVELFKELSYETFNCFNETYGSNGTLGRKTSGEVVLISRLRFALEKLNSEADSEAIDQAIEKLIKDRSTLDPVRANQEIYKMIKNGVKVEYRDEDGEEVEDILKVIDWNTPKNNDFLLASQFWVTGQMYKKRADLVGFVNGLPWIFVELKAPQQRLEKAYYDNLCDYKNTIPQLFWYNNLIILSNGTDSRVGTITSNWEYFSEWKRINSENEEGVVSLDTVIKGTCEKNRLFDLVENFILFCEMPGGLIKMLAKNHQFLGVNNAIEAVQNIRENQGRLGVFWHTQGSGKSYSMVFFSQKILRKVHGNWTFLIVTDREELDDQIYKNFVGAGVINEEDIQARDGEHLKQLLRENHRYVFTLIQKFRSEEDGSYPLLSERSDIIVITDEAHRSQYDTLAMNMRKALPNAAFIAFTGTPLIAGEEKTKEVFGDYVSIYNFRQSIEDKATVPLYYENRIPELQLTNEQLNEDIQQIIEEAQLNEEQENKLEREFSRQYHLITRDDRLELIAEDIVSHFMNRGYMGKAMVISIDKATAIKMYDKVQEYWQRYFDKLKEKFNNVSSAKEQEELKEKISYMEETDMAVVVSEGQNEIEEMKKKGVDIVSHRQRMKEEDLETKFKDPDDPFRLVFVCAMWITGFDVHPLSTIYLDKPMRNHTLMQAIARANRVFGEKENGLIVDYIGIFRDLQKALAIYGSASGGGIKEGDSPVESKENLVKALQEAIKEAKDFCEEHEVDIESIKTKEGMERLSAINDAVENIIINDDNKSYFVSLANRVEKLHKAIRPDPKAEDFKNERDLFVMLRDKINSLTSEADITEVMYKVDKVLDESVAAEGYVIRETGPEDLIDLNQIDFDKLKEHFEKGRKRTEAEKLRTRVNKKLNKMVKFNKTRIDYLEKFQNLIDEYNAGSMNVELFFDQLLSFTNELKEEEKRGIAEQLTEEELAVFDLLTKPGQDLTEKEKEQVKKVARELLKALKESKLVLDWRKRQQSRAQVYTTIKDVLDRGLPRRYTPEIYNEKCQEVYQHIYDNYYGEGKSIYSMAG